MYSTNITHVSINRNWFSGIFFRDHASRAKKLHEDKARGFDDNKRTVKMHFTAYFRGKDLATI